MSLRARQKSDPRNASLIRKLASICLSYPDAAFCARMALVERALEDLDAADAEPFRRFTQYVASQDPYDLAAAYVDTFDQRNQASMYLTWWSTGEAGDSGETRDDRDAGEAPDTTAGTGSAGRASGEGPGPAGTGGSGTGGIGGPGPAGTGGSGTGGIGGPGPAGTGGSGTGGIGGPGPAGTGGSGAVGAGKRGEQLVRFINAYREAGYEYGGEELPDYLPVLLDFASSGSEQAAVSGGALLAEHRGALERLRDSLAREGREAYAGLVAELIDLVLTTVPVTPGQAP